MKEPLISIVTPTFNRARFLEETILSILNQNYANLEYIIIDGGSTDGTIDIIRKYEEHIAYWVSEPDEGMYDAINKGFSRATGSVFGWINSDDTYLEGAFQVVGEIFSRHSEIAWVHGREVVVDQRGDVIRKPPLTLFHQHDLAAGLHGFGARFVAQHCCFWRAELWRERGPIPKRFRYAGDYFLWTQLAKSKPLISVNYPIATFRSHSGQLHKEGQKYHEEVRSCLSGPTLWIVLRRFLWSKIARRFTFDIRLINFFTRAQKYRWIDAKDIGSIRQTFRVVIK